MKYKQNWEETKEKFRNYWKHQNTGRPLMIVVAEKKAALLPEELRSKDMEDKYMNPERMVASYRHWCENHEFLGESFPNMSADFGRDRLLLIWDQTLNFRIVRFGLQNVWKIGKKKDR